MPDPETGEPIGVSHMIPRSREDLARRHKALRQVAEYSVGLMGRTPDLRAQRPCSPRGAMPC